MGKGERAMSWYSTKEGRKNSVLLLGNVTSVFLFLAAALSCVYALGQIFFHGASPSSFVPTIGAFTVVAVVSPHLAKFFAERLVI